MRQYVTGIQYNDSQETIIGWGAVIEDDYGKFSASINSYGYVITESLRKKLNGQQYHTAIGTSKQNAIEKLEKILSDVFETKAVVHEIPLVTD